MVMHIIQEDVPNHPRALCTGELIDPQQPGDRTILQKCDKCEAALKSKRGQIYRRRRMHVNLQIMDLTQGD